MEQCWKIYIIDSISDRYNLVCYIDAHEKQHPSYVYGGRSGGGKAIPQNLTIEALYSLG